MTEAWCVIMAGGSGTRFWPRSRRANPKQFLAITGESSLLQETFARVPDWIGPDRTLVVTGAAHVDRVREQLDIPARNVIGEPVGRDTAACIGLAASIVEARSPGAPMVVLAADHVIRPAEAFHECLKAGVEAAVEGHALVTIGIEPRRPATGYGYIRVGEVWRDRTHEVGSFAEKPDLATAEGFLASGDYLWNAGIFVWRADMVLGEIARQLPELDAGLARIREGGASAETLEAVYPGLEKVSIDHGVMEGAARRMVVRADFEWDDVGSFLALERHNDATEAGNVTRGTTLAVDAHGCIVDNDADGIVCLLGVEDLVVVRTGDAVLVTTKARAEQIKDVVADLEGGGHERFV